jgi:TDG/mug DNA glycosylase family protein
MEVRDLAERTYSFEPVWAEDAEGLILGTMPSVASLRQGFYYAHPRNAFWPMMFDLLNEAYSEDIEARKRLLIGNRIALWDVARSAVRPGSLDSAIRDAAPNDIPGLIEKCPGIRVVLLNGTTAHALFQKLLPPLPVEYVMLPSTSPANTMAYAQKRTAWAEHIPLKERP